MNEDQWESIIDLLSSATEHLGSKKRRRIFAKVCDELRTNPRFFFLEKNVWHCVDPTVLH